MGAEMVEIFFVTTSLFMTLEKVVARVVQLKGSKVLPNSLFIFYSFTLKGFW